MDYQYWNNYYNKKVAPTEPSAFAKDILHYLDEGRELLELGCGNGRDSILFAQKGLNVTAIDQSEESIIDLREGSYGDIIKFIQDDFIKTNILGCMKFNYIYSRFTMHSIKEEEESILIQRVYNALKKDGMFFIEVRSVKDDIYGLGEEVARNTYIYQEHSRRFIVIDELIEKLKLIGFSIVFANEDKNYAIYKNENPVVIRIIVKK